ncbi:FAD-binding protein [Bradyrhizobium manausense]|uniref:FAD-binding protein n=1 Tax=Bradyrhizobium manausense TaxID=989370 RepID=UPI001BA69C4C|nr:FAD-binding protein [Bradyrhizobium manausense]MBR0687853.1 FAD-binding protein [Bradyrhizobium manausense]
MGYSITRRGFAKGALTALSTAALLKTTSSLAFARASGTADLVRKDLTGLSGELVLDEASRKVYADDFGKIVHLTPDAVLVPRSTDDIVKLVKLANTQGLKIGTRGMAHSMYGQAQIEDGVLVDMSAMSSLRVIDDGAIEVGGGSTWGPAVAAAAAKKRTLPVINDTFLSVGGSLSTAGFGPTTWNNGFMVDHTLELEVVTGAGDLVRCSEEQNSALFNAVLSGMGQCAIITKAVMRLVAAPTNVIYIRFFYRDDVLSAAHDLAFLAKDGRFNHLDLRSRPYPIGGLEYYVECGFFYDQSSPPPKVEELAKGLHFASQEVKTWTYEEYYRRAETCYSCLDAPKPSLYLTVPASKFDAFVGKTLNEPERAAYVAPWISAWRGNVFKRPLARVASEDLIFRTQFNRVLPNKADIPAFLAVNRSLYEEVRDLGGTRLTASAIPFTQSDWIRHYGPAWGPFEAAKKKYDPKNVLGSSSKIFAV